MLLIFEWKTETNENHLGNYNSPFTGLNPNNRTKCTHNNGKTQTTHGPKTCISRESNPGHIDGNDVFYH